MIAMKSDASDTWAECDRCGAKWDTDGMPVENGEPGRCMDRLHWIGTTSSAAHARCARENDLPIGHAVGLEDEEQHGIRCIVCDEGSREDHNV